MSSGNCCLWFFSIHTFLLKIFPISLRTFFLMSTLFSPFDCHKSNSNVFLKRRKWSTQWCTSTHIVSAWFLVGSDDLRLTFKEWKRNVLHSHRKTEIKSREKTMTATKFPSDVYNCVDGSGFLCGSERKTVNHFSPFRVGWMVFFSLSSNSAVHIQWQLSVDSSRMPTHRDTHRTFHW